MDELTDARSRGPGIARNAALLFAGRVVSAATTLVMLAAIGRLRGADALGVVGIGFALGSIASAIADGGTASLLVREASRNASRAATFLMAGLVYRIVAVPISLIVVALVANVAVPAEAAAVVLVAAGLMMQSAVELTRSVFNARQRMIVSATHTIVENLVWLLAIVVGLAAGLPLAALFQLALAVLTASLLIGLGLDVALAGVRPRWPSAEERRTLLADAAPFAAFSVVGVAYARIDPLLIGLLLPTSALAAAGTYFAAARLVAAFEYVPEAISRAVYPELSKRVVDQPATVLPLLERASRALVLVAVVVPGAALVAGPWLLETLFGQSVGGLAWVVAALAFVVPLRFLGYLWGMALTSSDAQGRRVAAALIALAIVTLVEVVALPTVGIAGAVVAGLVAAAAIASQYGWYLRARFGGLGLDRRAALLAIAIAAGATAVGWFVRTWLGTPFGEPVGGFAAVAIYALAVALGPLRAGIRTALRPARASGR